MFPHKMRGSFNGDEGSSEAMAAKMQSMQKTLQRMELLLSKVVSFDDEVIADASEDDGMGESSTLREPTEGFTTESSFAGQQ